jgi:hypothetical protein
MITIANNQNNATTASTPLFQDWNSDVLTIQYSGVNGAGILPIINFKIKDVIGVAEYTQYSEFRLRGYAYYNDTSVPGFLQASTYTGEGYPIDNSTIVLDENGVSFDFHPAFQLLPLLPFGSYSFFHTFTIEGLVGGNWEIVSSYVHEYRLILVNTNVSYNPKSAVYTYVHDSELYPFKEFRLSGDWQLKINADRFDFFSLPLDVTVTDVEENGIDYKIASGTGVKFIKVAVTSYYDQEIAFSGLDFTGVFWVMESNQVVGLIRYTVNVLGLTTFERSPEVLNFTAVKGIQEPQTQYIDFTSIEEYTLTHSPWLIVTEENAVDGIFDKRLAVTPIGTINMSSGQYTGIVSLTSEVGGSSVQLDTVINYALDGFLTNPYGDIAFTLDPKEFVFSTNSQSTYLIIEATIKSYAFFTSEERTNVIKLNVPFYQGKATIDLGRTIHRIMDKLKTINENQFQYKPAVLKMLCKEYYFTTNELIREIATPDVTFVAGVDNSFTAPKVLDLNLETSSATLLANHYVNFLITPGTYQIDILRNNVIDSSEVITVLELGTFSKKIVFETFQIGDVINVRLSDMASTSGSVVQKKFIIIPDGDYDNTIVFEDEFLLQKAIHCTGDFGLKTDVNAITSKTYNNWVEILNILEVRKDSKFTINTGWKIETDIVTIDSLLSSKKAWINYNGKIVELRPIMKSIINKDSSRGLIEFALEFQINRKYNEENF